MSIKEIVAHFGVTVQAIFYACKRQKSFLKKMYSIYLKNKKFSLIRWVSTLYRTIFLKM
ncbi:IS630 transposase-related protein [Candidatus Protochlamydia sp. R18]|uniref:IS630 transposase-related protein n=1 Tax=Candidatus Protochlamydia sp. R18 TaxID=1353977 RepID=UPI000AC935B1